MPMAGRSMFAICVQSLATPAKTNGEAAKVRLSTAGALGTFGGVAVVRYRLRVARIVQQTRGRGSRVAPGRDDLRQRPYRPARG